MLRQPQRPLFISGQFLVISFLKIEVAEGEDIVGIEALASLFVDELWLPGTNVDLRDIGVAEVPHHEYVALIAIAVAVPLLLHRDSVDAFDGRMRDNHHVVERHLDVAIGLEGLFQVL